MGEDSSGRRGGRHATDRLPSAGALTERAEEWVDTRELRIGGRNPFALVLRVLRAAQRDRVTGLAAEMAFFALLSLVPAGVALGAGLGFLERVVGPEPVARGQETALRSLGTVFTPQVTEDVLRPLAEGLLEERGGIALSSFAVALFLASRVFTATIRALDQAYRVQEGRNLFAQRALALAFAAGAVVVGALMLVLSVVGPLLGSARDLAQQLGLGGAFELAWDIARWPVLFAAAVGFFAFVYRFGPNVANTWRQCLPGAVTGVVLWLLVTIGFRVYLETIGSPGARFALADEAVAFLGRVVGAIVAAVLWTYLSSLALLFGGEVNAELARSR